jgi:hypothetical protein
MKRQLPKCGDIGECRINPTKASLGVTQKTAWFMAHRIRRAIHEGSFEKMEGRVESDKTFIGDLCGTYGKSRVKSVPFTQDAGSEKASVSPKICSIHLKPVGTAPEGELIRFYFHFEGPQAVALESLKRVFKTNPPPVIGDWQITGVLKDASED